VTSPVQFTLRELGQRRHGQIIDDALTSQTSEDGQTHGGQPGPEGFRPWASEPEQEIQAALVYTAEDLAEAVDEARSAAFAEGEAATRQAMANDIEQRRFELVAAIKSQLEQQETAFHDILAGYALVSQRLALALASALVPRALERSPLNDLAEVLEATLARLASEPTIEVHFSPDDADAGKSVLADIARELGLSAELKSVADPAVVAGGVEIRWHGGVINHGWEALYAEALDMIDHWLGEGFERLGADVETTSTAEADLEPPSGGSGAVNDTSLGAE
jgi:flagellar biosynthesis/type III secretory pathway protein FliH